MSEAKRAILDSVRGALGNRAVDRQTEYQLIPRGYLRGQSLNESEVLEMFEDRLRDYDCVVHRCSFGELPDAIALSLRTSDRSEIVLPEDFPEAWLPTGFSFVRDCQLLNAEIDRLDGSLTCCSVAIAISGTIVLQEGAMGQGRRVLSLLPDYHLCIVRALQIKQTVPEALGTLETTATLATTTISGPSATADIEMTRIRGVHGPRLLEVIIVTEN